MPAPKATNFSRLGVALEKYKALLAVGSNVGATSLTVDQTPSWPSSGNITIYDTTPGGGVSGATSETVAYSAASSGTITCSATTNAHAAGCLVVVTAAADAPTAWIPVKKFEPADAKTLLRDQGYRGSMVDTYGVIDGVWHATYGFEGDVFADTFPWWLGAILGDYQSSGGAAPFTHKFAQQNSDVGYGGGQPESLALTDYYGLTGAIVGFSARVFPSALVDSLTVTFNSEGLLTYAGTCTAFPSGIINNPTTNFSGIVPLPVWRCTATVGGSNVLYVSSAEIQMKRNAKVEHTIDGTQNPYVIWLEPLQVTGKATFIAPSEAELQRYLQVTQPAITFNLSTGAGASLQQVQAQMSKVAYSNTKVERSDSVVRTSTDLEMQANTTDKGASNGFSPILWTVQNAVGVNTYQ